MYLMIGHIEKQPREITRGHIARSYFYMIKEYNLVISDDI